MKLGFGTLLKGLAVAGGALIGLSAIKKVNDYQTADVDNDETEEDAATEIEAEGEAKEVEEKAEK